MNKVFKQNLTKSPFRVSNVLRGVFLSDRLTSISQKSAKFRLIIKEKKDLVESLPEVSRP